MRLFRGRTANDVWRDAARAIHESRGTHLHNGRGGPTREMLHVGLVIEQACERWVLCREPALNPAFAIAEVVWILTGRDDSHFPNFWNPSLPRYTGTGPTYHGAYGKRLSTAFDIDQLAGAFEALRANPGTRQVVLQIWDPRRDLPRRDGSERAPDVPCNVCSMLKVRDGRLEWTQVMRSNDIFRGLPHNIVQFTYLQELMATWLELEVGQYTHFSDSLHVYEADFGTLAGLNDIEPAPNSDCWSLPYDESLAALATLSSTCDQLRKGNFRREDLLDALEAIPLETAPHNLLYCLGADAARRFGWFDVAADLMLKCSNPALVQMWDRWSQRKAKALDSRSRVRAPH